MSVVIRNSRDGKTCSVYTRLNDRQAVGAVQPDETKLVFVYVDAAGHPVGVQVLEPIA